MIKNTLSGIAFIFIVFIGFSACQMGDCVTGDGEKVTKELTVDDFERFESNGSIDITLRSGPKNVKVRAYENIVDSVYAIVKGKTLSIEREDGCYFNSGLEVFVTAPGLRSIEVNGSGDIEVKSVSGDGSLELISNGSGDIDLYDLINIDNLKVSQSGSGDIAVSATNKLDMLKLSIQGSGDFEGEKIQFATARLRLSGSGDAEVWVTDSLNAELSGSGDVNVKGNPTIQGSSTGSGEVSVMK